MAERNSVHNAWEDLREVLSISFPVVIAMASHMVMQFVDTLMLARYGRDELAAVGAAATASFTFLALVMGTGNVTNTFVSQSIGRGTPGECSRYAWQGLYFGVAMQLVAVPLMVGAPQIFALFDHAPQVQVLENQYFRIRLAHALGTAGYASLTSFFQGIGRPGVPMVAAIVANTFNVLLDYVLIFGVWGFPEMGIQGAAVGTTVSSYFQDVLLLGWFLSRRYHEKYNTRNTWRLDLFRLKRLLVVGLPAGLSFMLNVASWSLFTLGLIGPLGPNILAANNVTMQVTHLSFMPAIGVHKGVQVLVGQYIGRRDIRAAKRRAYLGLAVAGTYMGLMGVGFVLFRRPIVRWFRTEAAIVEAGSTMLILAAIFQVFDAMGIIFVGALRGAGDTAFPAVAGLVLAWGLMLPVGYGLTYWAEWGYVGAWTGAALYVGAFGGVLLWRFAGEAWRSIDIFRDA
jgi:MATE family multidrug resistance protein